MKIISQRICVLTITIAVLCVSIATAPSLRAEGYRVSLNSDTAAIVAANKITGLDKLYSNSKEATSFISSTPAKYIDTTTAFLHEELNGRAAWKITYERFMLALDNPRSKGRSTLMNSEVWLDSVTGQILRIDLRKAEGDTAVGYRMPTPRESMDQLGMTRESYTGLPKEPPKVDLVAALSKCKHVPLYAKHTIIQYLLVICKDPEPFPAWVIYMRGYPAMSVSAKAPARTTHNSRRVINAVTGKPCGGTSNFPSPETD